jgi:2-amino-4-hydroxy-6-hydroxymethyldihydropteridine diphosphokinase
MSRARRTTRKRSTRPAAPAGAIAYLSLGSNRGNRRAHLESALAAIARIAPVVAVSSFYRTDPVGFTAQRAFWNAAVAIRWSGTAVQLLRAVQSVERSVGRTPSFVNGPREIDVDILDLGGVARSSDPILPHPRLSERRFVLAPLLEIAPEWEHPTSRLTAAQLLRRLSPRPRATRLSSRPRGSAAPAPASKAPRRGAGATARRPRGPLRGPRPRPDPSRRRRGGARRPGSGD